MSDVGCRNFTSRMSNFKKSDVGCQMSDVGCRILISQKTDFTSRMSDVRFFKSDVGWHL